MLVNELPDKFTERMKEELDPNEFRDFLSSYECGSHKALRINSLKSTAASPDLKDLFSLKRVEWCENGYYYDEAALPGRHPLHEAGAYYIQEASAMAPVCWLDVKPGMRVLDLCAAPGGKSTEIAELMENTGLLVANEPVLSRGRTLSLNIERMGISNTLLTSESPERLSGIFPGYFDRILVDAPCSGEGMFRKNPLAVNEWSIENTVLCASRQDMILREAAKMLVPGGILVYSTCTFNRGENEGTVERFLNDEEDLSLLDPGLLHPLPGGFKRTGILTGEGRLNYGVRLYPHRIRGEGHFFAVIKRKGGLIPNRGEKHSGVRPSLSGSLVKAPDSVRKLFTGFWESVKNTGEPGTESRSDFTRLLSSGILHVFGEQLYLSNAFFPGIKGLKVLRPGLHLGTLKRGRFVPSHALALFLDPGAVGRRAELSDKDTALKYLRGESLSQEYLDPKDSKGWCLVCYMGMNLGWGSYDGRMIKNHYPKGLRLPP